jgi:hypothetical protein
MTTPVNVNQFIINYITQAEIVHRKGNPAYYNTMKRLNALTRLLVLKEQLKSIGRNTATRLITRHAHDLKTVLPVPANHSYSTTRQKLSQVLSFCETLNAPVV